MDRQEDRQTDRWMLSPQSGSGFAVFILSYPLPPPMVTRGGANDRPPGGDRSNRTVRSGTCLGETEASAPALR